ncbi:MAG: hypothetical protein IKP36_02605 [Bacteroidaceae bacterium]|nr:hypothetical protein [Bacteroidaceae bacterium]
MDKDIITVCSLYSDARQIIESARSNAVRSVDFCRVQMYWQLEYCRQFYRTYPIANTVRSQLNWSQYRPLIQIPDPDKRTYYELESVNNSWTARETKPVSTLFAHRSPVCQRD